MGMSRGTAPHLAVELDSPLGVELDSQLALELDYQDILLLRDLLLFKRELSLHLCTILGGH